MVILGPNGSGKTTLLMILCTILKPTSGTAKVMGIDVVEGGTKVREVMGIAFQEARGFWRHKPSSILRFHASMFDIDPMKRQDLIEQTMKDLELWESRDKKFMHLSGGQAKRLETAKVLVQRPKLAIFDEPTSQVDLRGKRKIWDKIRELRDQGSTVIVATNEVREAEYLADRVTNLAAFNIRVLLGDPTWFILSWALFALQLAIYGSLISRLVGSNLPNYFFFYSIGLMIIVVFESAEDVGRHFVEHAHEGELPYFLSLPVSRSGFLVAQAIYGVVNTLVKVAPPLLAVLFIWGNLTISGALFALAALFLLGLGITGTMVSLSFIAFKAVDIYMAVLAGLSALLIRFSTVFYPLAIMPNYYSPVSVLSPLTYGADLTRWVLGFDPKYLLNPVLAAVVVTAIAVSTLSLSARIVDKIIEGVKAA